MPSNVQVIPCPSWCEHADAGHGFDDTDMSGNPVRFHERSCGDDLAFSADLVVKETAAGEGGPLDHPEPPYLEVWVHGNGVGYDPATKAPGLTGPQARVLAAALLDAADAWDGLQ